MEKQIQETKQLRKDIDSILQRVRELHKESMVVLEPTANGFKTGTIKELSIVETKLQEAVMWLGMNLKRIDELKGEDTNPYPDSKEAWEYRVVVINCRLSDAVAIYADRGWEFVEQIGPNRIQLRRPNTKTEPTADGLKL